MRNFKITFTDRYVTVISGRNVYEALQRYNNFRTDLRMDFNKIIKIEEI